MAAHSTRESCTPASYPAPSAQGLSWWPRVGRLCRSGASAERRRTPPTKHCAHTTGRGAGPLLRVGCPRASLPPRLHGAPLVAGWARGDEACDKRIRRLCSTARQRGPIAGHSRQAHTHGRKIVCDSKRGQRRPRAAEHTLDVHAPALAIFRDGEFFFCSSFTNGPLKHRE